MIGNGFKRQNDLNEEEILWKGRTIRKKDYINKYFLKFTYFFAIELCLTGLFILFLGLLSPTNPFFIIFIIMLIILFLINIYFQYSKSKKQLLRYEAKSK